MKYSNRIAEVRKTRGISQSALAERIGATLSMVGKLERGERKLTSAWIDKLSIVLRCRPTELLAADENIVPAGEICAGGLIELTDGGAGLPEMEGISWGEGSYNRTDTPLRSLRVSRPITISLPVNAELVYDVLQSDPFDIKLGVLSMVFFSPSGGDPVTALATVMQGSEKERYHVAPIGGGYIENAKVDGAFQIVAIKLDTH